MTDKLQRNSPSAQPNQSAQPIYSKNPHFSLWLLLSLYLAQGLPVGFMTQALPALLRHYGVSLAEIGASGLLMLPWAIKFLWAPVVDQFGSRRLGHYRGWIIFTQSLILICLLALAFLPIDQMANPAILWGLFTVLFCLNLFCATQDIATDGLAVNILKKGQLHWGNSFQVIGSRLGFLIGGGAVLYAIDLLSWKMTFLLLSLGVFLNSIPVVFYKEPLKVQSKITIDSVAKDSILLKFHQGLVYLWQNTELKLWFFVLLTYKVADGLSGPIIKPMMIDMGLSLAQIGLNVTVFGALCALLGALLAGLMIRLFGLQSMFVCFAILQSLAIIYYVILAYLFENHILFSQFHLYIANALEEFCSALALVAMLSLIMRYARQHMAGTDFTFHVAIMSMVSGGLYVVSGGLAEYLGYFQTLLFIFVASLCCLIPKLWWYVYLKVGS
uniref:MFS transporter n=1 Tax=uncultured Acinetobacter sp. TaxID=165433 RepID=UPI002638808E|nr:MFS transporter [uncultured Acinetobacter sp.]